MTHPPSVGGVVAAAPVVCGLRALGCGLCELQRGEGEGGLMLLEPWRTMGWKRWVGMGGLREEGGLRTCRGR